MDQYDRAQALELADRERVLQHQREAAEKADKPSLSHCEDCGDPIPEKRREIRGVTRCFKCQNDFESLKKRGLR